MKINPNKYPSQYDIEKWLKFKRPGGEKISLVFARRLAALAFDMDRPMTRLIGYRSTEEQTYLYNNDKQLNKGNSSGKVSVPGTSWHEFNCAIDMYDLFYRNLMEAFCVPYTRLNQGLNRYGLMLPLNKVDGSIIEWWHLQPIESNGIPSSLRKSFLDTDDAIYGSPMIIKYKDINIWVTELKRILKIRVDDEFDANALKIVKAFQAANKLIADGIVGPKTWAALYKSIAK